MKKLLLMTILMVSAGLNASNTGRAPGGNCAAILSEIAEVNQQLNTLEYQMPVVQRNNNYAEYENLQAQIAATHQQLVQLFMMASQAKCVQK